MRSISATALFISQAALFAAFLAQASLFASLPARAQSVPPAAPVVTPQPVLTPVPDPEAQRLYESGVRLRRIGRPLTIAGAIAVPVGIALLVGGSLACGYGVPGPGYIGYPGY